MFKYSRVTLDRSETTKLTIDMPPWEVAVMAAANGNSHVAVIGETPVNRQLPDPAAEYDRLAAKYKFEGDGGRTYVSLVYGEGDRGIAELAKEIDKARAVARVAPVKTQDYDAGDDPLKGLYDDASVIDGEAVELTE